MLTLTESRAFAGRVDDKPLHSCWVVLRRGVLLYAPLAGGGAAGSSSRVDLMAHTVEHLSASSPHHAAILAHAALLPSGGGHRASATLSSGT